MVCYNAASSLSRSVNPVLILCWKEENERTKDEGKNRKNALSLAYVEKKQ